MRAVAISHQCFIADCALIGFVFREMDFGTIYLLDFESCFSSVGVFGMKWIDAVFVLEYVRIV